MTRTTLWLALVMATLTTVVRAQAARLPVPGDTVRVTAAEANVDGAVGTLARLHADTVAVSLSGPGGPGWSPGSGGPVRVLVLPLRSVTRLEVKRGRRGHAVRGAAFGFVGGAVVGAIVGGAMHEEVEDLAASDAALVGAGFGGLGFAILGGIIGAAIRTDRWEPVPLERLRVSLAPVGNGRVALGVKIRF